MRLELADSNPFEHMMTNYGVFFLLISRRECKARSVLNKFKEMEQKVINGEEEGKTPRCPQNMTLRLQAQFSTGCGFYNL